MTPDHKVKFDEIANEMFQIARDLGFHQKETIGQIPDNFGAWCANLHSEVSELDNFSKLVISVLLPALKRSLRIS